MEADSLVKAASTNCIINEQIKVQYIPSIDFPEVQQIDKEASLTTPLYPISRIGYSLRIEKKLGS